MTQSAGSVLEQALGFLRSPSLLPIARQRPLPEQDMQLLLRLAAGDEGSLLQVAATTGESHTHLAEAAAFYIQQVLFTPGTDSYRVLGVNPDASDQRIKDHHRALMRWLHPDRNTDGWEGVFVDRVNRAWQDLRSSDRRREYDRKQPQWVVSPPLTTPMPGTPPLGKRLVFRPLTPEAPILPSRIRRFLPLIVPGSLCLATLSLLALMYFAQQDGRSPVQPTHVASVPIAPLPELAHHVVVDRGATLANSDPLPDASQNRAAQIVLLPVKLIPADVKLANAVEQKTPEASSTVAMHSVPIAKGVMKTVAAAPAAHERLSSANLPAVIKRPAIVALPETEAVHSSVAIVSSETAAAQSSTEAIVMNDRLAGELLENFRHAYDAGNLPQLIALFTRAARHQVDEGQGQTPAETYRGFFASSRKRGLSFSSGRWRVDGGSTYITAHFDAAIVPQGKLLTRHDRGSIHFELQREDGEWRIAKLSHDNK